MNEHTKLQVQKEIIVAIQNTKDEYARAHSLIVFAPYLNPQIEAQVWALAKDIRSEEERAEVLVSLMPYLSNNLNLQAQFETLDAVRKIEREVFRTRMLIRLIPHLNTNLKTEALAIALNTVEGFDLYGVEGIQDFTDMFTALAPYLNGNFIDRAWLMARKTNHDGARIHALQALIPHMREDLKLEALTVIQEINNEYSRIHMLLTLIPYLSNDLKSLTLQKALRATQNMENGIARLQMLTGLIPHLSDDVRANIVQEILSQLRMMEVKNIPTEILITIIHHIEVTQSPEFFVFARQITNEYSRAEVLLALITLNKDLIPKILADIQDFKDHNARIHALSMIMPYLSNDLKQGVLTAALEINHIYYRATTLIALLAHLNDKLRSLAVHKTLESAREIPWTKNRADVLNALLPHLDDEHKELVLQELLVSVQEIDNEERASGLLSSDFDLIGTIIIEWKKINFKGMDKVIYGFQKKYAQNARSVGLSILSQLLPALVKLDGYKVGEEILRSIRDVTRWWP